MRFWVLIGLFSACGLDRNIESKVTIKQGVYGLLVEGCQASGCQDQPAANHPVIIYTAGQSGTYATETSDVDGVYQIDLPVGDYTLCTSACTPISIPTESKVRYDWTSGPGGGHWERL